MATTLREAVLRVAVEFATGKPPDLSEIESRLSDLSETAADSLSFDEGALDDLRNQLEDLGSDFDLSAATAEFERLRSEGLTAADALEQAFSGLGDDIDPIDPEDILRGDALEQHFQESEAAAAEWADAIRKGAMDAADSIEQVGAELADSAKAGDAAETKLVESFDDVAEAAKKMTEEIAKTPEELEEIGRAAVDEGIKASEGFVTAGEGVLTFARGITFLGITSESELGKVVEKLAKIQGGIDTMKGLNDSMKGAVEGLRAFRAAAAASSASTIAMTAALGPLAIAGAAVAAVLISQKEEFAATAEEMDRLNEKIPTVEAALEGLADARSRIAGAFSDPLFDFQAQQGFFDTADEFEERVEQLVESAARLTERSRQQTVEAFRGSFRELESFTGQGLEHLQARLASVRETLAAQPDPIFGFDIGLESGLQNIFPSNEELEELGSKPAREVVEAFRREFIGQNRDTGRELRFSMKRVLEEVVSEDELPGLQSDLLKNILFDDEAITEDVRKHARFLLDTYAQLEELDPAVTLENIPTILQSAQTITERLNATLGAGNLTAQQRNELIREGAARLEDQLGIQVDMEALLESQKLNIDIQVGLAHQLLDAHNAITVALENQLETQRAQTLELSKQFEDLAAAKEDFLEDFGALDAQERESVKELFEQAATAGVESLTESQAQRLKELGGKAGGQLAQAANEVIRERLKLTVDADQADALIKSLQALDITLKADFDTNLLEGDLEAALEEVQERAKALEIPIEFIPGEVEPFFKQFEDTQKQLLDSLKAQSDTEVSIKDQQTQIQNVLKELNVTRQQIEKQIADAAKAAAEADVDAAGNIAAGLNDLHDANDDANRAILEGIQELVQQQSELAQQIVRILDDRDRGRGI